MIVEGRSYRVKDTPEIEIMRMGFSLETYPAGEIVKVVLDHHEKDWYDIVCPDGLSWAIKGRYLTNTCIWEKI